MSSSYDVMVAALFLVHEFVHVGLMWLQKCYHQMYYSCHIPSMLPSTAPASCDWPLFPMLSIGSIGCGGSLLDVSVCMYICYWSSSLSAECLSSLSLIRFDKLPITCRESGRLLYHHACSSIRPYIVF